MKFCDNYGFYLDVGKDWCKLAGCCRPPHLENQQPVWWHLPSDAAVALMLYGMVSSLEETHLHDYHLSHYTLFKLCCDGCLAAVSHMKKRLHLYLLVFLPLVSSFAGLFLDAETGWLDEACKSDAIESLRGRLVWGSLYWHPKIEEKLICNLKNDLFKKNITSLCTTWQRQCWSNATETREEE